MPSLCKRGRGYFSVDPDFDHKNIQDNAANSKNDSHVDDIEEAKDTNRQRKDTNRQRKDITR
jgi:hypothetical protein